MNATSRKTCLTKLQGLFQTWTPTADELLGWNEEFMRPSEADSLKAIQSMFSTGRSNTPRPRDFHIAYEAITTERGRDQNADEIYTGWWVQCVSNVRAGRVGMYVPVVFGRNDGRGGRPDLVRRSAEAAATKHRETYGGEWEVYQGATREEMETSGRRLRAAAENPQEQL